MTPKSKRTREQLLAALDAIRAELHESFPDAGERLAQLDSHLATVSMVVDHIHEEAARAAGE